MRIRTTLFILLALLVVPRSLTAFPTEDDIKKKRSELEKIRKEIETYDVKIKAKENKEHATLELLDTYDRQGVLVRKLIGKLHDRQNALQQEIAETKQSMIDLTGQISFLKRQYAQYVSTLYKYGRTHDVELLLTSNSINQLLVRSEYLRSFSNQRQADLARIDNKRDVLESKSLLLQKQSIEWRELIAEKATEEKKLSRKMAQRKVVLADIRRDKKHYQREMKRKIDAAKELEQLVAKLIEEDRKKKELQARLAREGKAPAPVPEPVGSNAFDARRGRLRWPVSQGKVLARFGEQRHPVLHAVTQNTGIDISVPQGTNVSAVADGEVSAISWLPSFGNLVILNHSNGFRTVYAHLSDVTVNDGQKLEEGDSLGKSGEALSGPMLHFEIWKDREKQDPEEWLHPRGLAQH